jgi:hypothetical protein
MKHRKTEHGRQTFKEHSSQVNARQRSAFIMFDGIKDDATILKLMAGMGLTVDDIHHLESLGLIEAVENSQPGMVSMSAVGSSAVTAASVANNAASTMTDQERYQRAYPVAVKLASGLGLRGFRLNMSVEAASSYKDLMVVAPKIKEAVGDEKFAELARALNGF